jgi:excisionase family DNA binding protein
MTQSYSLTSHADDNANGGRKSSDGDDLGLMTPGEVAAILHVDANTVARWSNNGKLRAVRTPGGHRRYYAFEVLAMARSGMR